MINIICSSRYKFNRHQIKKAAIDFLKSKGLPENITVNLVFVGRNKMKKLSLTYKNENEALPVLSFVYNEKNGDENLLGEVIVCYPQAVLLAAERNKKVDDTIIYLITHGLENLLNK